MANLSRKFGEIYDQHINKIYRFVYLKVSSQEIAEDLTSEVFSRGWQAFKKQKSKIDNVQAFLYQIARNLITDHYREKGKARLVSAEFAVATDSGINLEEKAALNSDLDQVKGALANINEDYREMIIWYYLDELSVPEIAKMLKKSEIATRVMIHRALRALQNDLKGV